MVVAKPGDKRVGHAFSSRLLFAGLTGAENSRSARELVVERGVCPGIPRRNDMAFRPAAGGGALFIEFFNSMDQKNSLDDRRSSIQEKQASFVHRPSRMPILHHASHKYLRG
jgi:hypothetical protein